MNWFFVTIQVILGALVGGLLAGGVLFIIFIFASLAWDLYEKIRDRRK